MNNQECIKYPKCDLTSTTTKTLLVFVCQCPSVTHPVHLCGAIRMIQAGKNRHADTNQNYHLIENFKSARIGLG